MSAESFAEFCARIEALIPTAAVEVVYRDQEDRGEVVIYTGLWLNEDDDTVDVES